MDGTYVATPEPPGDELNTIACQAEYADAYVLPIGKWPASEHERRLEGARKHLESALVHLGTLLAQQPLLVQTGDYEEQPDPDQRPDPDALIEEISQLNKRNAHC